MEWVGCICCEKFQNDFMAPTCALIAPVQPILHRVSCSNETLPNAPKLRNAPKHEFRVQWGGSGAIIQNFRCDFVAQTFALIAPVQPVLHQALCSNETIQNAPKHYEMQQYMSLGFNGVERVRSLRKIPMRFHDTNLCSNCTSSTRFALSFV